MGSLLSPLSTLIFPTSVYVFYFFCLIPSPAARPRCWRLPVTGAWQRTRSLLTWPACRGSPRNSVTQHRNCHQGGTLSPSTLWTCLGDIKNPTVQCPGKPVVGDPGLGWDDLLQSLPISTFQYVSARLHDEGSKRREMRLTALFRVMKVDFELYHWVPSLIFNLRTFAA